MSKRGKLIIAILITGVLLFGCTTISTLNPSDNGRLFKLMEERKVKSGIPDESVSLRILADRIEAFRSSSVLFRTKIENEKIIIESFSSIDTVKSLFDNSFKEIPDFWEKVTIVSGNLTNRDRLPEEYTLKIEADSGLIITKVAGLGNMEDMVSFYKNENIETIQALMNEVSSLLLFSEDVSGEIKGQKYVLTLFTKSGAKYYTFDINNRLYIGNNPNSHQKTYSLVTPSQWSSLKSKLDNILKIKDTVSTGSNNVGNKLTLDLPWMGNKAIGHEKIYVVSPKDKTQVIYIEAAYITDLEKEKAFVVKNPPEKLSLMLSQRISVETEDKKSVIENENVTVEEAKAIVKSWGLNESVLIDAISEVEEKAFNMYLQTLLVLNFKLDPSVKWR